MQGTMQNITEWCEITGSSVTLKKASVLWCSLNNNIKNVKLPEINCYAQVIEGNI